jgi:hypothetical protein
MPRCVGLLVLFGSLLGVLLSGLPSAYSLTLTSDTRLNEAIEVDRLTVVGPGDGLAGRVTVTCGGAGHAFVVRWAGS